MTDALHILISNILVASLIGSLAWLIGRSGERARLAHVLWVACLVKLITPPLVLLPVAVPAEWLPAPSVEHVRSLASKHPGRDTNAPNIASVGSTVQSVSLTDQPTPLPFRWFSIWRTIVGVWLCGIFYVLARGLIRFLRFQRLLKREGWRDDAATEFVAGLVTNTRNTTLRTPEVLQIPVRVSPMLFGFGHRPVIVCPDTLWQSLSDTERHSFLAHEAAHFCRRDHWVRWLEWIVTAVYWWFPGVYFAKWQIERHEEACCDAWAVRQLTSTPRQYAEALLKVVDFISEQQAGIPQLASGMRPTDGLEERLRFVMQGVTQQTASSRVRMLSGTMCVAMLLLHPVPQPTVSAAVVASANSQVTPFNVPVSDNPSNRVAENISLPVDLPPAPQGFWNRSPEPQWADFSLALPGAQLKATAGRGVTIELPNEERLYFSADELRAIVQIPASQRIVVGSRDGAVRIWDLTAGTPVSLLGQHAGEVTSMAFHDGSGLVSADADGSIMRWNLQSGQILATATISDAAVQSVRYSVDGRSLAILSGAWDGIANPQVVRIVDSTTLEAIASYSLQHRVAVVVSSPTGHWLGLDWQGQVRDVESEVMIGRVAKENVSAMTLAADGLLLQEEHKHRLVEEDEY